jgi:hypothetical protein
MDPSNFIAPFYDDSSFYQDQDYSFGQALTGALTFKNMERLIKISKCWIYSNAMEYISADEQICNEIKIYKACTEHNRYKILKNVFESYLGDLLLITSRNIAQKDVIRNETDKSAYLELRESFINALKEHNLEPLIGYDQSKLSCEFLETIQLEVTPKSARANGVCLSSSYYFMEKVLNSPELNEAILIEIARELQKGVPAKVAAIQEIYIELLHSEQKKRYIETHEDFGVRVAISNIYGYKVDIEGSNNTRSILSKALTEDSNIFESIEFGIYEISFDIGSNTAAHSIAYIKLSQVEGYFFDSNIGLIKCGDYKHSSILFKLLNIHPSPITINSITKVSKV